MMLNPVINITQWTTSTLVTRTMYVKTDFYSNRTKGWQNHKHLSIRPNKINGCVPESRPDLHPTLTFLKLFFFSLFQKKFQLIKKTNNKKFKITKNPNRPTLIFQGMIMEHNCFFIMTSVCPHISINPYKTFLRPN